jgi:starch synthase
MQIVFVSPELAPFSRTGELADVVGTLPTALRARGLDVTVITPFYQQISPERYGLARRIRKLQVPVAGSQEEVGLLDGKFVSSDVPVIFIDHPASFQRPGLYGDNGEDYPDNARRFHMLCAAALTVMRDLDLKPDVVHALDWQTGLLPLLARRAGGPQPPVLFTVLNPAFQGLFPPDILDQLGLGWELFNPEGIEFHGQVSLLKAGLVLADQVSIPSPTAAREMTNVEFGLGLHGVFSSIRERLSGILLGVDSGIWNPAGDYRLAAPYSAEDLGGKAACKQALLEALELPGRSRIPLLAMLGPFREDSGIQLVLQALEDLPLERMQLALLGEADPPALTDQLQGLAATNPRSVAFRPECDVDTTHRVLAGADALLHPGRYEPGPLLPLKAMRYGTAPIVRAVGGMRDSVVDFDERTETGTGLTFGTWSAGAVGRVIHRYLNLFEKVPKCEALAQNAMRQQYGWERTAELYGELYGRLVQQS